MTLHSEASYNDVQLGDPSVRLSTVIDGESATVKVYPFRDTLEVTAFGEKTGTKLTQGVKYIVPVEVAKQIVEANSPHSAHQDGRTIYGDVYRIDPRLRGSSIPQWVLDGLKAFFKR